ncbi:MAG: hypothetical protein CMJ94_07920 [Planctomycetes bacterium]|nr:hypothetical protein [Planctomycetota bacterium]
MSELRANHVLLVEDNPADARLTALAMEEAGLPGTLATVGDGERALDYLFRRPPYSDAPRPDLVLLDLNMPRLNGKACLARLRADERTMDLPVIILSTSDSPEDISDSYRLHASFYLVKPGDFSELVEAFQSLREFWFEQAAQPDTEREESVAGPSD